MKSILFKPEMIQAIIEGRKTQTRRPIKQLNDDPDSWQELSMSNGALHCRAKVTYPGGSYFSDWLHVHSLYHIGEPVYIKEAFMFKKGADIRELDVGTPREVFLGKPPHYLYRLDDTEEVRDYGRYYKWRSPMMMPQKAARLFIRISSVRAERLQSITEEDAKEEGAGKEFELDAATFLDKKTDFETKVFHRLGFKHLWEEINGAKSWDSNPWVWVYGFQLVPKEEACQSS